MPDPVQEAIAATLLRGPGHLPAGLFAGDDAAVLRGLRVHANTISHARLVALEQTFPHCRALLGETAFNRLSRAFVDAGHAQHRAIADIGAGFPDWLSGHGDRRAADLARIEWLWLESYHAAEAIALTLTHLAELDEAALLTLPVRRHPAARVIVLQSDAAGFVDTALAGASRLLIARADVDVRLHAIEAADMQVLTIAADAVPLGNLMRLLAEQHSGGAAAVAALIAAGAFRKD